MQRDVKCTPMLAKSQIFGVDVMFLLYVGLALKWHDQRVNGIQLKLNLTPHHFDCYQQIVWTCHAFSFKPNTHIAKDFYTKGSLSISPLACFIVSVGIFNHKGIILPMFAMRSIQIYHIQSTSLLTSIVKMRFNQTHFNLYFNFFVKTDKCFFK